MQGSLADISRYVYGTTRLGDESISFKDRVAIARAAIEAGTWIHTSNQYGDALNVLRAAFDVDRAAVPPTIFKLGWSSPEEVRGQVVAQLATVGNPKMDVGQIFPGGQLAQDLRFGGAGIAGLTAMKSEGLVGQFVVEVWPWSSDVAIDIFKNGHAEGVIDACIFYLNPLQRMVTNEVWDLLLEKQIPIIAMRTISGGHIYGIRDNEKSPAYLRERAASIARIFDRSGIASWPEFAARFSLGVPGVLATVGATSTLANLNEFLSVTSNAMPLPEETMTEIYTLQRSWSDDHDRHAAPWSM